MKDLLDRLYRQNGGVLTASLTRLFGPRRLEAVENPAAWLMTVARNRAFDVRKGERRRGGGDVDVSEVEDREANPTAATSVRGEVADDELRMMFVACHPLRRGFRRFRKPESWRARARAPRLIGPSRPSDRPVPRAVRHACSIRAFAPKRSERSRPRAHERAPIGMRVGLGEGDPTVPIDVRAPAPDPAAGPLELGRASPRLRQRAQHIVGAPCRSGSSSDRPTLAPTARAEARRRRAGDRFVLRGWRAIQGGHQGAQQSTRTGRFETKPSSRSCDR